MSDRIPARTNNSVQDDFFGPAQHRLRLRSVAIENYKSLDQLRLELPAPSTEDQLDVFVLGSKNGVGKSSLLECCALNLIGAIYPRFLKPEQRLRAAIDLYDILIRAGESQAQIGVELSVDGVSHTSTLELKSGSGFRMSQAQTRRELAHDAWARHASFDEGELLDSLLGRNSEPIILPPVLFFHSYRKVQEGNSDLGAMLDPMFARRRYASRRGAGPLGTFKAVLVQALMARSGLFEGVPAKGDSEAVLTRLNGLIEEFAGGTVDKLRPGPDGTLELRVTPRGNGSSFSFDGLSSGQKEIIATLFLIWYTTQGRPSIVLIDEPELHLNAEWQRIFIHQLGELAPDNQYILATHSEEIFGSVTEDRRLMLQED